ncbi:MAG: D-alanine--D-alanine ligase [Candidatus Zapsychrus exili]|nr:D-alanine--D-alanine ligase [Candidatus Zapsychrus exili]
MSNNIDKFGKIGVLMGGYSSERDISLKSGKAIYEALKEEGCDCLALDITSSIDSEIEKNILDSNIDLSFIALHGKLGEDGKIQGILDNLDICYVGSSKEASCIAFDKELSQDIFKKEGIPIPKYISLSKDDCLMEEEILRQWNVFPCMVKPSSEGSSIGISKVTEKSQLTDALNLAWEYSNRALVEDFIEGREITVGVLGDIALPIVEISTKRDFFDFAAKYKEGMTNYIVPAEISVNTADTIKEQALKAHRALGCSDFSRVDFILSKDNIGYVLEVNTIPGFTSTSLLPKAAKEFGLNFNQLCIKLMEFTYAKKKKKTSNTVVGN